MDLVTEYAPIFCCIENAQSYFINIIRQYDWSVCGHNHAWYKIQMMQIHAVPLQLFAGQNIWMGKCFFLRNQKIWKILECISGARILLRNILAKVRPKNKPIAITVNWLLSSEIELTIQTYWSCTPSSLVCSLILYWHTYQIVTNIKDTILPFCLAFS